MNAVELEMNDTLQEQELNEAFPKWQSIGTPTTPEEALEKYEEMVYRLVKAYPNCTVCSTEDMVQEGRCAIVDAFNTYDPTYNAQLGTWTYRRIKDALANFFKKNSRCLSGGATLYQKIKNREVCDNAVAQRLKESFITQDIDELVNVVGDEDVQMESARGFGGFNWREYLTEDEIAVVEYKFGFRGDGPLRPKEIGQRMGGRSAKAIEYIWHQALPKLQCIPGIEDFWFN